MNSRFLLAVTQPNTHLAKSLGIMAGVAGLDPIVLGTAAEALDWLEEHDPHAVVVDLRLAGVNGVRRKVRSRRRLCQVPVIALTPELSDDEIAHFIASGVDEVLPLDARSQLLVRLQALPLGSLKPPKHQGVVIVADPEPVRCDIFGRLFSNAGYDVKYALDDRALVFYDKASAADVVVLSPRVADPMAIIQEARALDSRAVWIVTASRRDLASLSGRLRSLGGTLVIARDAPPSDALFFANELRQKGATHRKAPRKLFGTQVRFKPEGAAEDDFGFSYNISERGIYVRTLAPPKSGKVWLQVRPPMSEKWVCLEADVAWRRRFDAGMTAAVPPGFGVRFVAGLGNSLAEWQRAVNRFMRVTPKHSVSLASLVSQTLEDEGVSAKGFGEPLAESVPLWGAEDEGADTPDPPLPWAVRPLPSKPPTSRSAEKSDSVEHAELEDEVDAAELLSLPPEELSTSLESVMPPPTRTLASKPPLSLLPDTSCAVVSTPPNPADLLEAAEPADSASGVTPALITDVPPPPRVRRSRLAVLAAVSTALVVMSGWLLRAPGAPPGRGPAAGGVVAPVTGAASVPPNKPALSESRHVGASASARAEPVAKVGAVVTKHAASEASAVGPLPMPDVTEYDDSDLNMTQGGLVVRSAAGLRVVVQGIQRGSAGARLIVPCGYKHVRLRAEAPGAWRSEGQPVMVECGATTIVSIAASD